MLDHEFIRKNALPQVFERGEALFQQGAVRQLIRAGNTFTAEVQGTYRYQQTLNLETEPPYAACTCPYSDTGWCKHLVAVAIAIIHEQAETTPPHQPARQETTDFFRQEFSQAPEAIREAFLRQLFRQRPELKQAFRSFLEPGPVVSFRQALEFRDALKEQLEKAGPADRESIFRELKGQLERSSPLQAVTGVLGATEAAFSHPDHQAFAPLLDDLSESAVRVWKNALVSPSRAQRAVELILDRWSYLRQAAKPGAFPLKSQSPLLQTLAAEESVAHFLLTRLEAFLAENPGVPELYILAAQNAGNKKALARYADRFKDRHPLAAEAWLDLPQTRADAATFTKAVRQALAWHGESLLPYLAYGVDETTYPELYAEVLEQRAEALHSLDLYRQWKMQANKASRDAFVARQQEHPAFYLNLLVEEKAYPTIRKLAASQELEHLGRYLEPLLDQEPAFCFETIRKNLQTALQRPSSRETYRLAAGLMVLARKIPEFQGEARELIRRYQALDWPALQAAMKSVGLIR